MSLPVSTREEIPEPGSEKLLPAIRRQPRQTRDEQLFHTMMARIDARKRRGTQKPYEAQSPYEGGDE
jgi:hypothetical protein